MPLDENATRSELVSLGARLRALRTQRGWTLDELAQRADLSKSYLSRLEDGDRQPSIAALLSLAQAHRMPLAALFGPPETKSDYSIVRAGEAAIHQGNRLQYIPLSQTGRAANMQPIRVIVPADREGDEMYQHDGEEWLYVLSGVLRLTLAGETLVLHPGDAAHFNARAPHRLAAEGGGEAEIILVACAAPKMLLDSYL
ncbi:XRE family transcriptional regulator [Capsulimonas corticalis]|uniref:XRE family transcriptional regulator n=1 Tax=Capsulimonas corticalis TaxID=2219043 RepID=A0A402CVF0_9BACT|nr:cupin domain-containing protein [Capsulimonas corticalis]BDI30411.1 XRE family transcriptional regulator [Capsulimonas corticalis]